MAAQRFSATGFPRNNPQSALYYPFQTSTSAEKAMTTTANITLHDAIYSLRAIRRLKTDPISDDDLACPPNQHRNQVVGDVVLNEQAT